MDKIKVTMNSGQSLEKGLVTAFKTSTGEYVVLDNEMLGTMGLPIILVSKLENGVLNIVPDTEWNTVKETLRLIIAGNQVDYIKVELNLQASDTFFKQLTLPLASFDALKNNYHPVDTPAPSVDSLEVNPMPEVTMPEMGQPIGPTPQVQVQPQAVAPEMVNAQAQPQVQVQPQMVTPEAVAPQPIGQPETMAQPQAVEPVSLTPEQPQVQPVMDTPQSVPVDFTADKEAFMKACENMFDALVAKFNNK